MDAWRWVARWIGGFHELGPLFISIDDRGCAAGWRRVEKLRWRY